MPEQATNATRPWWDRAGDVFFFIVAYAGLVALVYFALVGAFGFHLGGFFFGFVSCAALETSIRKWRQ